MGDQPIKKVDPKVARKSTLEYFGGDDLATSVWINKYALRDRKGNLLESSPKEMHDRIIGEILRIENKYPDPLLTEEILREVLYYFRYIIPGGSNMSGIGNNHRYSSLSNCFVIGNPEGQGDSYGGIFAVDQGVVQIAKRRGGIGTDLSDLRPDGAAVSNDAITSSGVVSFMERYSNSVKEVGQRGRLTLITLAA
jgi:Ribonucleotide reductase, barrel domain.